MKGRERKGIPLLFLPPFSFQFLPQAQEQLLLLWPEEGMAIWGLDWGGNCLLPCERQKHWLLNEMEAISSVHPSIGHWAEHSLHFIPPFSSFMYISGSLPSPSPSLPPIGHFCHPAVYACQWQFTYQYIIGNSSAGWTFPLFPLALICWTGRGWLIPSLSIIVIPKWLPAFPSPPFALPTILYFAVFPFPLPQTPIYFLFSLLMSGLHLLSLPFLNRFNFVIF